MVTHHPVKLSRLPRGSHLVTDQVLAALTLPPNGVLHLFLQHTSAALAINENASPDVRHDMDRALERLVPEDPRFYTHTEEGPDDMPAHVKSVLCGNAVSIPIVDGKLALGRWQGIYLLEFRREAGPRTLLATILS